MRWRQCMRRRVRDETGHSRSEIGESRVNALSFKPVSVELDAVAAVVELVSDTHFPQRCRQLPPVLFDVLAGVDLILHRWRRRAVERAGRSEPNCAGDRRTRQQ